MKSLLTLLLSCLMVSMAIPADLDWGVIRRGVFYQQTGEGSPSLLPGKPFTGQVLVRGNPLKISEVSAMFPSGAILSIPVSQEVGGFEVSESFASFFELNAVLPSGRYFFETIDALTELPTFFGIDVPQPLSPPPPLLKIANLTAAQRINPAADFLLRLETSNPVGNSDHLQFLIFDPEGKTVHKTGELPGDPQSMPITSTTALVPANTLKRGLIYTAWMVSTRFPSVDDRSLPGVRLAGAEFSATQFTLKADEAGGGGGGGGPLVITTLDLPIATLGKPYQTTLAAAGGTPPYRWSVTADANSLTPGLSIDASTGVLSGTPLFPDLALVNFQVTDAANQVAQMPAFLLVLPGNEPVVLIDPFSEIVEEGDSTVLEVLATGAEPMFYQWQFQGVSIPGANEPELFLLNLTARESGDYRVIVENAFGSVTSRVARVSVLSPPQIVQQPRSQTANIGQRVEFSVQVAGAGPFTYQWQLNGENIPGANATTYVITAAQAADSGDYSVVVQGPQGAGSSDDAELRVIVPELRFSDRFVDRVSFNSAEGSGSGSNVSASRDAGEPLHAGWFGGRSIWIEWVAPTSGIATFTTRGSDFDTLLAVYTGTSLATLVEVSSDEDSGEFFSSQVRFNAEAGTRYAIAVDGFFFSSGTVVLSWNLAATSGRLPLITVQPTDQIVAEGRTARFTVTAANSPPESSPISYQWFRNFQAIPGANAPTLTIAQAGLLDLGIYQVEVRNGAGAVRSLFVFLEIGFSDGATDDRVSAEDKFANAVTLGQQPPLAGFSVRDSRGDLDSSGTAAARGYSGVQIFSSFGSSTEEGEPNHCGVIGGASQWFTYLAEGDGPLTVSTDGSDFDTVLAVYTGSGTDFQDLKLEVCDNDGGPNGRTSLVRLNVKRGTTYYIAVDGVRGATGNVRLSYNLDAPPQLIVPRIEGGVVRVSIQAQTGKAYSLQWSQDMVKWNTLKTVNAEKSVVEFVDDTAGQAPSRFYRVFSGR